jgi:class 3 adenylate cyclase
MDHRIGYAHRDDGVSIAYGIAGSGPPLVFAPGWVSHLEYTFEPPNDKFWELVGEHRQIITYDKHGTGLSDRERTDFSLDSEVKDLATVVEHLHLDSFDLMAASEGGPVGITYAASHSGKIRRFVLYATFALGPALTTPEFRSSFIAITRASWGVGAKTITDMLVPGASAEDARLFARMQRATTSAEIAAGILESLYTWDVTALLPTLTLPTLVIQRRGDRAFSPRNARMLAAGIPDARLVLLDGDQHSWARGNTDELANEIVSFLNEGNAETPAAADHDDAVVRTILFTDLESHTPLMSRLGDDKGRDILREHERRTRDALRAHGGSEVKSMGDGFMASFGSAQRALECARAIQDAFSEPVHGEVLKVRIGDNAGEPVAEDDDLFGTSVIAAARIASKATGGQVLVADVVRQLVAGKGFLFHDTGDHDLKGLEEPVRLWELRLG